MLDGRPSAQKKPDAPVGAEYLSVPQSSPRINLSHSSSDSESSLSASSGQKNCEYALAFLIIGIRLAGKVLMTYYGAKKFLEHTHSIESVAAVAWMVQNVIPGIDGVQNIFMGGTSGYKTVRALVRTPALEFQSLKQAVYTNPIACSLVALRLTGGAILRGSVIDHILFKQWGEGRALATAITISGLFAFSDIKFSASSDLRLLKRLWRWVSCQPEQSINISDADKAKVETILGHMTTVTLPLDDALSDLEDSKKIRRFVRTKAFRHAYFADRPNPSYEDEWHFTQAKNALVVRASHYSSGVELTSRIISLAVNLPFFYLSFLKNESFAGKYTPAKVALAWACLSSVLKVLTAQGKSVEGMSDSLSSLDRRGFGKVARTIARKPHTALFCLFAIIPFSVFGAGQILDMPQRFKWINDTGANVMLGVFLVTQLFSYTTFIAPRIFKRSPACCCFKENSTARVGDDTIYNPMIGDGMDQAEQGLLAQRR
ncbi:MAG: hypothetical protein P1U63_04640 [Coxiellaceae bacterium]|nr:hypothetical protein [Coxiellaceae bacterium]